MSNDSPERSEVFMRRAMLIGLASVAMTVAACSGGSIGESEGAGNTPEVDDTVNLLIEENTENVFRGRFATRDGQINFLATSANAASIVARLQINDKVFDLTIDGSYTLDGHNVVLTPADKALVQALFNELSTRFTDPTTVSPRVYSVANLASYLSEAPVGHIHPRLVDGVVVPEGTLAAAATKSIICLTKGKTYTATYTAKSGATTSQSVLAGANWGQNMADAGGDYNCMGMCGAACNGILGLKRYSQDCLNHDTCSHNLNASGGASDINCGDEYNAASDDSSPFNGCTSSK